ncbi:hypothetical protein LZC95_53240 [Pendulispora brunnea]|uniref:Uncharacterized protein n=1 Tax=Pendulispora brunnea TaxID=2905690 RepID=A0ABZ2K905_9BACT
MHPKLKFLLALLVTMAVWFTAAPAWASELPGMVSRTAPAVPSVPSRAAPLCDIRGATMFAPTPTLDGPSASVDVGEPDASCLPTFEGHSYEQGHHPSPSSSGEAAPEGLPPGNAHALRMPLTGFVAWPIHQETAPAGVRHSIERPPRLA